MPFLSATDEAEANRLLGQLMSEHAIPLIRKIVNSNLRASRNLQHSADLTGEVALHLVKRLRNFKSNPEGEGFNSFLGYIAVTARNACHLHLRQEFPERSRLKHKLRYILTHHKGFSLWEAKHRNPLCGFTAWRDRNTMPCPPERLYRLRDVPQALADSKLKDWRDHRNHPAQSLKVIFERAEGPIELDDLVDIVANLWQVKDLTPQAIPGEEELVPDPEVSVVARIEQRQYLQHLWSEICQLPLEQRRALLLNLRDANGNDIASLFAHTRIAVISEIAEALAMTAEEFAELWNDLPLDDLTIAGRLGITRQQVINLRSAARKRLARRMEKFERGNE